ncbi:MAG: HAD family hydrolase [Calditrichaceae bacterium]|nr:HAD family hydrolase [Calditrichaceae bacterium]MBN2707497.1 HAD family hydrolase [Calditrichaceae bacterium]RQV95588.1 MAG: HAD family hydrolase [Calditrichota bacterium]
MVKVFFLDRDGIINKKPTIHRYVTKWDEFKFNPDIFPVLKSLAEKGFRFVVITNQQGIGKGEYTEETLAEIHRNMINELDIKGIHIDGVFHCPHLESDNCFCRKPKPGLLYKAMNELNFTIDLKNSFFLGDSYSDIKAGNAFGIKTILIGPESKEELIQPDYRIDKLTDIKKLFED